MRKSPGPSEGNEHYKFISGTLQLTTHIIINVPSPNQASFEQPDSFRDVGSFLLLISSITNTSQNLPRSRIPNTAKCFLGDQLGGRRGRWAGRGGGREKGKEGRRRGEEGRERWKWGGGVREEGCGGRSSSFWGGGWWSPTPAPEAENQYWA